MTHQPNCSVILQEWNWVCPIYLTDLNITYITYLMTHQLLEPNNLQ